MIKLLSVVATFAAFASAKVRVLTNENFDATVQENKYVLVKFYAPWCGHCKKLAPEFEAAATRLEGKAVLADLDATEQKEVGERFDMPGFPTLFWFVDGVKFDYGGDRTANSIVEWVEGMTGPAITEVESLPEVGSKPQVVLYGEEMHKDFEAFAQKRKSEFAFFHVKQGEPKVTIQHMGEEASQTNMITSYALEFFINDHQLPLFGELNGETHSKYMASSHGLVWSLFPMESPDNLEKVVHENQEMMMAVATHYKDRYAVSYTNTAKFRSALDNILGATKFPTIAVNKKAGDKTKFLYTGEMTSAKIIEFIAAVEAGTIEPSRKSEPIPVTQKEAVHVVVGDSIKKEVFHAEKDVLIEIYASWCGHCKELAPEWEKVAKKVQEEGLEDIITVAKMDGQANDSPVETLTWEGFPTIYYVKAGTNTPTIYDGPREAKGIWQWIKLNHSKADVVKERIAANQPSDEETADIREEL